MMGVSCKQKQAFRREYHRMNTPAGTIFREAMRTRKVLHRLLMIHI